MTEKQPVAQPTIENRPLTKAQNDHLEGFNTAINQINAQKQHFMTYLAAEYNCPASEGWTKIDTKLGFVREVKAEPSAPVVPDNLPQG